MSFETELKVMVTQIKGCEAAVLMGLDGIAVSEVKGEDSMQEAATEYSRLLAEGIKIAQGNSFGPMDELMVTTDKHRFLFRLVSSEYFLGLMLSPQAYLGKGRFYLRRAVPNIQKDL